MNLNTPCKSGLLLVILAFTGFLLRAQEQVAPLRYNPALDKNTAKSQVRYKTTANTLPFFEDFTDYSLYPNPSRWTTQNQVYVNNTMGLNVISRGVATFDALNASGRPYDTVNMFALSYADSLTSQPFDLSGYAPGDSIYLSFFYQPQGNGFSPETSDSLMLFLRSKNMGGTWTKVWAVEGSTVLPFRQVMIPVADTNYLYSNFQFRFVNKASINVNDDVWNVDYIRMNTGRTYTDTLVADIAFTADPSFLLNDYTYMPYRQFLANTAGERAAQHNAAIRNNNSGSQNVNHHFTAKEQSSGFPLAPVSGASVNITAGNEQSVVFTTYTTTAPSPGLYGKVVFENKYYLEAGPGSGSVANDTIIREQIFDNYLAYDDGTAEKSYYLNLFATLPGKIAIEHHLNQPDTLRGLAILFGQQVPTAAGKFFSIQVYKTIAGINGGTTDNVVYTQDFNQPRFIDTVNRFYIYAFDSPVPMTAGVFYVGVTQPALSGSDSLYYALDANRVTGNHLYYNVLNTWTPSTVTGAVMVRPLLGQPVRSSSVKDSRYATLNWSLYPNPGNDDIFVRLKENSGSYGYEILDLQGRSVQKGMMTDNRIDAGQLPPGMYLVRLRKDDLWSQPLRWIKL